MHLQLPAANSNHTRQICLCNLDLVILTFDFNSWLIEKAPESQTNRLVIVLWLLMLTSDSWIPVS